MNCLSRLFWILAFLAVLCGSFEASERPVGVTAYKVSPHRADLYWFYPEFNDSTLAHDDGSSDVPVAVIEDDRDNRVAVRFDQLAAPTYICVGSVYILNYDDDPSIPGTPLSPVEISLHLDSSGRPGVAVAGPFTVSASGNWMYGGEWVDAPFDYVHLSVDPLWLQMRWPSSNPFMPKIGADYSAPDGVSVVGYRDCGEDVWLDFTGHDIMLRLGCLRNTKETCPDPAGATIDSFRIYRRDRLPVSPDDDFYMLSTYGWELHRRVELDQSDNYFCVTAWLDGVESEPSDAVQVQGSAGHAAPVTIVPRPMVLAASQPETVTAYMAISSKGDDLLRYRYKTARCSDGGFPGIPMVVIGVSGAIGPDQTDSIEFRIYSSDLEVGDYHECGAIEFEDDAEVYLPESVSVYLSVSGGTAAEEVGPRLAPGINLHQNFPNPFNSETVIAVEDVNTGRPISLRVVDILGSTVAELHPTGVSGRSLLFRWDGTDDSGSRCPSGLYFYSISGDGIWRKMLLLK
jgi:hypothetical protein